MLRKDCFEREVPPPPRKPGCGSPVKPLNKRNAAANLPIINSGIVMQAEKLRAEGWNREQHVPCKPSFEVEHKGSKKRNAGKAEGNGSRRRPEMQRQAQEAMRIAQEAKCVAEDCARKYGRECQVGQHLAMLAMQRMKTESLHWRSSKLVVGKLRLCG